MVVWCCKRQIHGRLLTADGQARKADTRTGTFSYTCSEKYDRMVDNDLLKFESVALHGPTDSVAAGLSTGKIFLWYDLPITFLDRCERKDIIVQVQRLEGRNSAAESVHSLAKVSCDGPGLH